MRRFVGALPPGHARQHALQPFISRQQISVEFDRQVEPGQPGQVSALSECLCGRRSLCSNGLYRRNARAFSGPTPGTVINWRHVGSVFTSSSTLLVSLSASWSSPRPRTRAIQPGLPAQARVAFRQSSLRRVSQKPQWAQCRTRPTAPRCLAQIMGTGWYRAVHVESPV
jgi:hypothetical protein